MNRILALILGTVCMFKIDTQDAISSKNVPQNVDVKVFSQDCDRTAYIGTCRASFYNGTKLSKFIERAEKKVRIDSKISSSSRVKFGLSRSNNEFIFWTPKKKDLKSLFSDFQEKCFPYQCSMAMVISNASIDCKTLTENFLKAQKSFRRKLSGHLLSESSESDSCMSDSCKDEEEWKTTGRYAM